jgi:hypothetical protein
MLAALLIAFAVGAPLTAAAQNAPAQSAVHDGADDFNWEIGLWSTHVQVRAPLDANAEWATFDGASNVHALANGRANTVDLSLVNAAGNRIEGVSLRLFNPQTGEWNINYASMRDGALTAPVYGSFRDGRGVFYGQDTVGGRVVMVRFVIADVTANSARFVQSYSADGGQTWIDNWIATDTRRR